MIKTNIAKEYPAHSASCAYSDKALYFADYTECTKLLPVKRGVEIFQNTPPDDIDCFTLQNEVNLLNGFIIFDNASFTRTDGSALSQCECVVFPETAAVDSWIFFVELKYSNRAYNNNNTLRKAIFQLYRTRTYYFLRGIISKTNPSICWLLYQCKLNHLPKLLFLQPTCSG